MPQRPNTVTPPGQDLVRVALVGPTSQISLSRGVSNTAWIATVSSTTPRPAPRCPPVTDTAEIVSARNSSATRLSSSHPTFPRRSAGSFTRSSVGVLKGRSIAWHVQSTADTRSPDLLVPIDGKLCRLDATTLARSCQMPPARRIAAATSSEAAALTRALQPKQRDKCRLASLCILLQPLLPACCFLIPQHLGGHRGSGRPDPDVVA